MMTAALLFIQKTVLFLCDAYVAIIIVYVLMSWIPNNQYGTIGRVYRFFGSICDPFLNLFKRLIPPIGGYIDISPIFAIIVIQLLGRLIAAII